jgi:hypothetical protein
MLPSLSQLRQTAQLSPTKFLAAHPGCWIQYYDDTPAKDPAKALSARTFDVAVARRKQLDRCAVGYSLQAFGEARTKEGFLSFRNLGVDVDLVEARHRGSISVEEIDRRKGDYLERCLLAFPLKPHWLVETRHGFHAVFRVMPLRKEEDVQEALSVNRALIAALRGDAAAGLLTQILRVPSTFQFKDPRAPFLCRLLLDNSGTIFPYDLAVVRSVLDAREAFLVEAAVLPGDDDSTAGRPTRWQQGLDGVTPGMRNATAASLAGAILWRLPETLWETAGWGGLKEWNRRNAAPLPEREMRAIFESIVRRERAGRRPGAARTGPTGLSSSPESHVEH